MAFPKGHKLSGSRKDKPNEVTKSARELFVKTLEGQVPNIQDAFEKVRKENPSMYLNLLSKYAQYFVPKMVDITSGGDKMNFVPISKFADDNKEPEV
jgi:hypothetical protein